MVLFDDLKTSLEEAVEIKEGRKQPSVVTRYELANVKIIRKNVKSRCSGDDVRG